MGGRGTGPISDLHPATSEAHAEFEGSHGIATSNGGETADVVIENYRPDLKFASGSITRASLINKRIVLMVLFPASVRTTYREVPGFDQIAQGNGGLMSITVFQVKVRCASAPCRDLGARHFLRDGILIALLNAKFPARVSGAVVAARAQISLLISGGALVDRKGRAGPGRPMTIRPASRPVCFPPAMATSISSRQASIFRSFCQTLDLAICSKIRFFADEASRPKTGSP